MVKRTPPSPKSDDLSLLLTSGKIDIEPTDPLIEFSGGGPLRFREVPGIPDTAPPDTLLATYELRHRENPGALQHYLQTFYCSERSKEKAKTLVYEYFPRLLTLANQVSGIGWGH